MLQYRNQSASEDEVTSGKIKKYIDIVDILMTKKSWREEFKAEYPQHF